MKAKLIKGFHVFDQKPGDYAFSGIGIMLVMPCGHFFNDNENKWNVQNREDETKVTLSPSLFCHADDKDCWHGFLRNGEFIDA